MASSPTDFVQPAGSRKIKVVVATSVMLSFISFWRAAAIVLNDLGSSAFYVGGIAEQAVGPAAPWFILGVMLFSYAVRSVYVESCAMFTRGGVYRVVKEAMGGTLAKLSVSALMFDYVLTGPISGVSAGQYIVGLIAETLTYFGHPWAPTKDAVNLISAGIAVVITVYFWWRNTRGIHESSDDALKIMYVVTAMVVILIGWSTATIVTQPYAHRLPPAPFPRSLVFNKDSLGWIRQLAPGKIVETSKGAFGISHSAGMFFGLIGILIAFGHSFLAMSGEESLAQVNRELAYPKHRNLMKAGLVIFIYSLLFTSLVSFFAYAIIPDPMRTQYSDNLISGIALHLLGPEPIKLLFQGFIVVVGFLMLAGAVNTAIIGSNGVLNRVSEDGVLTDWFRHPHRKYGTTHRIIDLVVILQLVTIIASRGNVYTLGEAYAFGVIWSFAFKGLAMLVLRFKDKSPREWKVPFNFRVGKSELPLGLGVIALILFSIAGINLFTKQVATVSGIAFTLIFFVLFWASEHWNAKREDGSEKSGVDQFKIVPKDEITPDSRYRRPGNVLCLVRDYNSLSHLRYALEEVDTEKKDLVVLTIRTLMGPDTGYEHLDQSELFTSYEQRLFSEVVSMAERAGKHVELMVVPSSQVFQAIALTATQLQSSEIIAGASSVMTPEIQARQLGQAWELVAERPGFPVPFRILDAEGRPSVFFLGAHRPELAPEDVEMIHRLWLDISGQPGHENVRHRDVVSYALIRLQSDLSGSHRQAVIHQLGKTPQDR